MWSRVPLGARFMIGAALAFSVMSALVKHAGLRLPSQELVFARSLIAIAISVAMLRRAGVHTLGNRRWLLLARGIWGFAALSCGFYAMTKLPLAEATMIQYLHPIFTALLASVVLGERADRSLAASVVVGTLGVLLVTRPAFLFGAHAVALDPWGVAAALGGQAPAASRPQARSPARSGCHSPAARRGNAAVRPFPRFHAMRSPPMR